jgi:hypothetical protein
MFLNLTYMKFFLPDFTERAHNNRVEQKVNSTEINIDMLQKSKNAVIQDRVIGSKIFQSDSVFSHDRGSAELFQMFFQIKTTPTVRWELGSSVEGKH